MPKDKKTKRKENDDQAVDKHGRRTKPQTKEEKAAFDRKVENQRRMKPGGC